MAKIRQRITVILPQSEQEDFHLKLELNKHSLKFPPIKYQRQDKFTIPSDIIPEKWKELLLNCESFRIQYSSNERYDRSIFGDYSQSGVNINFVPKISAGDQEDRVQTATNEITQTLSKLTGTDLDKKSYILTPTAFKYFEHAADTRNFAKILQQLLSNTVESGFNFLQIDFDPIKSENLILEVYWESYDKEETFSISDEKFAKEIGVFTVDEKLTNVENVGLNGVRFLFSDSRIEPKKTAFQFTPRQRLIPDMKFKSSISTLTGLHPVYKLEIQNASTVEPPLLLAADDKNIEKVDICKLYSVWNIPKDFFLDKYQLQDEKFQQKGTNLIGLFGNSNLELPSYLMNNWGTEALFELNPKFDSSFEIPLHSRYGSPSVDGYLNRSLPHPLLFWACDLQSPIDILNSLGASDGSKNIFQSQISQFESILQVLPLSPFHHKFLDYESYFDENTIFYQIDRTDDKIDLDIRIPVANDGDSYEAQTYTMVVVILAFLYLLRKVVK